MHPRPSFGVPPIAGVTNAPSRLVARECGAGLLTSEEIDLITGSSLTGDVNTKARTIRIFDGANGFREAMRLPLPTALSTVAFGVVDFSFADLDGDGRVDIVAALETTAGGPTYIIVYRNLGNFVFSDVTTQFVGGYELSFVDSGGNFQGPNALGTAIAPEPGSRPAIPVGCSQVRLNTFYEGRCLFVSEGTQLFPWRFTRGANPATVQQIQEAAPNARFACRFEAALPLFFDVNGDGVADVVLVHGGCTTTAPPQQTNILQVIVFISGQVSP